MKSLEGAARARVANWLFVCEKMGLVMGPDERVRAYEAALDTERRITEESMPYEALLIERYEEVPTPLDLSEPWGEGENLFPKTKPVGPRP